MEKLVAADCENEKSKNTEMSAKRWSSHHLHMKMFPSNDLVGEITETACGYSRDRFFSKCRLKLVSSICTDHRLLIEIPIKTTGCLLLVAWR